LGAFGERALVVAFARGALGCFVIRARTAQQLRKRGNVVRLQRSRADFSIQAPASEALRPEVIGRAPGGQHVGDGLNVLLEEIRTLTHANHETVAGQVSQTQLVAVPRDRTDIEIGDI
jgi:Tfp pilus assembly PilM family ATPase